MVSYDSEDFESWSSCIQKYGFVVLKNIFTPEQCDLTTEEFFRDINQRAPVSFTLLHLIFQEQKKKIDPSDPSRFVLASAQFFIFLVGREKTSQVQLTKSF